MTRISLKDESSLRDKILDSFKPWVIPFAIISFATPFLTIGYRTQNHYQMINNLEPGAMAASWSNNVAMVSTFVSRMPYVRNEDIDGNGLYESVQIYKNPEGEVRRQEVVMDVDGFLQFEGVPF